MTAEQMNLLASPYEHVHPLIRDVAEALASGIEVPAGWELRMTMDGELAVRFPGKHLDHVTRRELGNGWTWHVAGWQPEPLTAQEAVDRVIGQAVL